MSGESIIQLWDMSWVDGLMMVGLLMCMYTYKVWIDSKFKK